MLEANKLKVGLFVTFSVLLFLVALGALGVLDVLEPKVRMMTLFKESVQGLENGSAVKFRGVPIGKVFKITINAKEKLIRVDMEIDLDKVRMESLYDESKFTPPQFYKFIGREVEAGLRCRLELGGITGLKYIEIDYAEPEDLRKSELLSSPGLAKDGYYYIPSTPSLLSGLRTSLSDTLSKVASIDYKRIADELTSSLTSANKLFSDPRLKEIIGHVDNVTSEVEISAKNINATFTKDRMDAILSQISETINSLHELASKSREALDAAQLGETSASFREAVKAFIDSKSSFAETMLKFNETLDSATEFIQYMDGDPSSLLKGKRKAPVLQRRQDLAPASATE